MKLIRYGDPGREKPGIILEDGRWVDASAAVRDYDEAFFAAGGAALLDGITDSASEIDKGVRLGAPIARPSKIVCIGLNFFDHAQESNMKVPAEPVLFTKASTALCGPNDDIELPRGSLKTDWEVELAFVVGKRAKYVAEEDALDFVAGYAIMNDVSERSYQIERGGQWVKGKSADTFAPMGPFLATPDEIPDPENLRMWLKVNGVTKQDGSTSQMVFKVPKLVSYVSQFMTLLPGDVISTGTPAGVGFGMVPPQYLKAGDVVELGIDGLGQQRQAVTG